MRNLASKSDEAAKATKDLIENSITAVREGADVVGKVTESLERTSYYAGHVTSQMDIVVEAVESQTAAIAQVTEGVDQISAVVQTNSATAEESVGGERGTFRGGDMLKGAGGSVYAGVGIEEI